MNATMNILGRKGAWAGLAAGSVAVLALAGPAGADHGRIRVVRQPERVWVPPVYETVARQITIPAVYEDRARQVWREPTYEERQVATEVPAEIVRRPVTRIRTCGFGFTVEWVDEVIRPARTVWTNQTVLVTPGHYETVYDRVLVRPATTRVEYEQVLVRAGYWNEPHRYTVLTRSAPGYVVTWPHRSETRIGLRFEGRR